MSDARECSRCGSPNIYAQDKAGRCLCIKCYDDYIEEQKCKKEARTGSKRRGRTNLTPKKKKRKKRK